jgi:hypothetical protein
VGIFIVRCTKTGGSDGADSLVAVAVAGSGPEAIAVCRAAYAARGYDRFVLHSVIDGDFPGPAQVIGEVEVPGTTSTG